MKLGFRIALRFLKSNKGQTLLIILGIAIGVSVQIFIGSLIQGLQKGLIDKTIGTSSQITISSQDGNLNTKDYEEFIEVIRKEDREMEAISVALDNAALMDYKENSQSLLVRGFELNVADGIYDIFDRIVEGTYPKNDNEIILGIDLKEEYDMALQEEVTINTAEQKVHSFKVVGFFDFKVSSLNTGWGITTLQTAQNIFATGDVISSIELQLKEDSVFLADEIAENIKKDINREDIKIVNWKEQNESLLSGLQGQSISSYMIQVFVMISVVLGIASVLAITVIQKSKQIGILKAMGIRNVSSSYIFLFEGLILGFFGAILGIVLGLGLSFAFTKFALNPDGTPVIDLYINYSFIMISGIIALLASAFAAMIPAAKSSRLNPIDIIRNN
ncbi:ABC transporter permease [Mobilitalea sibirica]|uniref:ABC transporter permease n=1 Tax=Mobilitalea sibirica TaxID=1462919 RepID=A0A8J7H943_9FIRM|nr:ABC transporter permease [Mobilitalea sibirica]MBH1940775.1 ABC transporter permease [Mobilitalea sibirica]